MRIALKSRGVILRDLPKGNTFTLNSVSSEVYLRIDDKHEMITAYRTEPTIAAVALRTGELVGLRAATLVDPIEGMFVEGAETT